MPDSDCHSSEPLLRGPNKGYRNKFGHEWTKGPSRTKVRVDPETEEGYLVDDV